MPLLVLNTRPTAGGGHERLNDLINALGDKVYSLPLIQTQAIDFTVPDLNQYPYIIFVSQAAVHGFMRLLKDKIPPSCQCICIGKASAGALKSYGVEVRFFSPEANSEALVSAPVFKQIKHQHFLWVKGNIGRRVIEEKLLAKGAHITELQVYQSSPLYYPVSKIDEASQLPIDLLILTSEQSLQQYHHLFEKHAHMFDLPCVLVISERLATLAKTYFKGHILISRHDLILETIKNYKASL